MKVYTKIVIDMHTGAVLEERCYQYEGPVAYCGGGGMSAAEPDKAYNRKMAMLSQENQEMAREMFNIFKYGVPYDPNERIQTSGGQMVNPDWEAWRRDKWRRRNEKEPPKYIPDPSTNPTFTTRGEKEGYDPTKYVSEYQLMLDAMTAEASLIPQKTAAAAQELTLKQRQMDVAMGLLPLEEKLKRAQMTEESRLVGERGALESAQIGAAMGLLPLETDLRKTQLSEANRLTQERGALLSDMYKNALAGVDVDRRVAESRAGVNQAFANSMAIANRNLSRMGIDPGSGRGLSLIGDVELERAKAMAAGEGAVRREAESENFQRKQAVLGLNF